MSGRKGGSPQAARAAWYAGGLRFACARCGHCCTGEPGYVFVTDGEIRALAEAGGMDEAAFRKQCVKRVRTGQSLRERANGDCIFFRRGEGCVVYNVRPTQCRTYPFWPEHMRAPEDWDEAAQECPGMNRGRLHSQAEIDEQLRQETEGESR